MKAERKPTKKGVRIKNKCPCAPSARDLSQQLQQTLTIPADVMAAAGQQPGRPRGRPGPTPTHRHRARDQRAHALHDHEANSFNTPPTSTTPALERTVCVNIRASPRRPVPQVARARQVKTRVDGENLYSIRYTQYRMAPASCEDAIAICLSYYPRYGGRFSSTRGRGSRSVWCHLERMMSSVSRGAQMRSPLSSRTCNASDSDGGNE